MNEIVPSDRLVRYGMTGISGTVVGVGLLFLSGFAGAGLSIAGLVVGGGLTAFGLSASSKAANKDDRAGGMVTAGAGALTVVASLPLIGGLAGGLMSLAGFGLLGYGGYSLFKFIKGLRARR